jgi:hypothetical protein
VDPESDQITVLQQSAVGVFEQRNVLRRGTRTVEAPFAVTLDLAALFT